MKAYLTIHHKIQELIGVVTGVASLIAAIIMIAVIKDEVPMNTEYRLEWERHALWLDWFCYYNADYYASDNSDSFGCHTLFPGKFVESSGKTKAGARSTALQDQCLHGNADQYGVWNLFFAIYAGHGA